MTATTATNGKPQRKQLADEIDRIDKQMGERLDRLDSIIDALAEGLSGAVTDACREGAREAVRTALVEVLSNPEIRAILVPPPVASPEPKKPGLWSRIKSKVAAARNAVAGAVTKAKEAVIRRCVIAGDAVVALGHATGESIPVRRMVLVGLGVGLMVGVACLVLPQTTAAVISGAGAACTAMSVQVGNWLTCAARRVGLLS